MSINKRRDPHVAPKYFLLRVTSLLDRAVEIVSEYDLGVMFVTSMSFSVEGLWLLT